ncbi:MAG: lytic transglycosylase F [Desulfobacteraceae bacterium]|nr:lytic transglycosylase F [Desulfobacteraceae bacterium]
MAKHLKNSQKNAITPRSRSPRIGARMFYPLFFILTVVLALSGMPREVKAISTFDDAAMKKVLQPWKGDLNGMIERRFIRVLVTYNKTDFFLDGAVKRGFTHEIFHQFEKFLYKKLRKKGATKKHLRIHIVYLPVSRDRLLPYLNKGLGDIAAGNLTITPKRLKKVGFATPYYTMARELVVTGPSAPPINSVKDLSGKTVYVRRSSSYFESLIALNKKFASSGKAPVKIEPANENLETEDILEMANADLIRITVADNYLANFWSRIFKNINVHQDVALKSGQKIAWAIRKKSPQLKKALDQFAKKIKVGTLLGNMLAERYYENTKWARNALSPEDIKRFNQTIDLFRKYAGKYGFDYLMVTALGYQESRLDHGKRSNRGAIGVMQILPKTAAGDPINIVNIHKLDNNIHAGVKYLHFIYNNYYKNAPMDQLNKVLFTFASYNAGPARVTALRRRAKKMGLDPNRWFRNVEVAAARVIGRETVQYVSNILKYYIAYKQMEAEMDKREQLKKKKLKK